MAPTPTAASRRPSSTRRGPRKTARTERATSPGIVARSSSASPSSWARRRERARQPALAGVGRGGGLGRGVEQHRHDVHAGDAVHERVVGLRQHREAVALEALDEPDLPERLVAVELLGEHAAGEVPQLLLGAGGGERGRAHVVAQVQVRVVDPLRAALAERHEGEPLAVARHQRRGGARWPRAGRRRAGETPRRASPPATCMWADASSRWRNDASSPVRRSEDMAQD